ncbi:MAG: tryptophan 2,3-dioxygenase [Gemmatimonadota bacterium]
MAGRDETDGGGGSKYLTYSGYLKLDELLALQQPRSGGRDHDEMLFIVIHQVYELWFKELLHELEYACRLLEGDATAPALHTMKRVLTILKVLVSQLDILETMTPLEFLAFRERLEAASGLESRQFRELEFLLGLKDKRVFERYPEGGEARAVLERRLEEPTLWDAFLHYLAGEGYAVPEELLGRDVTRPVEPSPGLQGVLIDVYRENPAAAELCERLVDLDEGLQEWRYRHVKMVERTIGAKRGTGGTSGVEYLKRRIFRPLFPDLWEIRTQL